MYTLPCTLDLADIMAVVVVTVDSVCVSGRIFGENLAIQYKVLYKGNY